MGDGLAKGRAPKPRAAELSLCKPEKLVSPDVLVIPPGITLCFSGSTLGTVPMVSHQGTKLSIERSNYAARAPHEALVRARCQSVIPSADYRKVK